MNKRTGNSKDGKWIRIREGTEKEGEETFIRGNGMRTLSKPQRQGQRERR